MNYNKSVYKRDGCYEAFGSLEVDAFYTECFEYINNLPSKEQEKYSIFLNDKRFRFMYMQVFRKQSLLSSEGYFHPYTLQFDGPDDMFQEGYGPNVDEYNKITKNIPHEYEYLANNFFKETREILEEKQIYKTGTLIFYKPSAIILPHVHTEDNNVIQHTLLNNIKDGEFNFWHTYTTLTARSKGDSFSFNSTEVHFAECSGNAWFLAVDKF